MVSTIASHSLWAELIGYTCVPRASADLITAMTWPIDVAEELKELDDEIDAKTDYTTLLHAQLRYKAATLQPGVLKALLAIMTPSLAKTKRYASTSPRS